MIRCIVLTGIAGGVVATSGCASGRSPSPQGEPNRTAGSDDAAAAVIAAWEAKVGQPVAIEGEAYRTIIGGRYLRPVGDAYPHAIELPNALADLACGRMLPVRVTGTLRMDKHTVTAEEVARYQRDLAEGQKQMQAWNPQVGQVVREFSIPDAVVTVLPNER
jgi:hypothetical protein